MSTGDRKPYEILAVQLGMAGYALTGNANIEHADLYRFSEKYGKSGGIVAAHEAASVEITRLAASVADLELMLRAALDRRLESVRVFQHEGMTHTLEGYGPCILTDDGTGLPILTPASRAAIQQEGR